MKGFDKNPIFVLSVDVRFILTWNFSIFVAQLLRVSIQLQPTPAVIAFLRLGLECSQPEHVETIWSTPEQSQIFLWLMKFCKYTPSTIFIIQQSELLCLEASCFNRTTSSFVGSLEIFRIFIRGIQSTSWWESFAEKV